MQKFLKTLPLFLLAGLAATTFFIWRTIPTSEQLLKVDFLNVGQGDAIFIESPTATQVIVDGGPDKKILSELGDIMPFYDKFIDLLVVTNPDKDHFAGFIDVLSFYKVGNVLVPGTKTDTAVYKEFERLLKEKNITPIVARRGQVFDLGGGALFTVLFPDRDVSTLGTNEGSIVARLSYGNNSVLFMGDAPSNIEAYLEDLDGEALRSTILKVGHHGSKTSTSDDFVKMVKPEMALISAGADNKYGHPHKEVTDILTKEKIEILGTYKDGRTVFYSNGLEFTRK
ncbi:MAG TPA: MBL fold metallo-hydrolase [Candidatus Paceibacterota bacterium]